MPRSTPAQTSWNAGEIPLLAGRPDLADYHQGAMVMENVLAQIEGPVTRCPGTEHIAEANTSSPSKFVHMEPLIFSEDVAYALQFGEGYMRVYKGRARIDVADTDAAISNGTFDSDITDWDDISSGGSATIAFAVLGGTEEGTFDKPSTTQRSFGDSNPNRLSIGLLFPNTDAGDVRQVRAEVQAVSAGFNCVAGIYEDSSGSPGSQVGGNSDTVAISAAGVVTFEWSASAPSLSASTSYWVVLTDTTADTTGDITLYVCADQGASFASGGHDTITSIADQSGAFPAGEDWRIQVIVSASGAIEGVLALIGDGSNLAAAEQDVAVSSGLNVEHTLKFRVVGNAAGGSVRPGPIAGDEIVCRIGSTSGGDQILEDYSAAIGYHAVSFTPTVSPFYVQFRLTNGKTLYVDDIDFIDNDAFELDTGFREDDLPYLQTAGSYDVKYLVCGRFADSANKLGYPIQELRRYGDRAWALIETELINGPWLPVNTDTTRTLQPNGASGNGVTITAAGFAPFALDEWHGRQIRIGDGYAVVRERLSTTQVLTDVKVAFADANPDTDWRFGVFSTADGQPAAVTFHEQRLWFGGAAAAPGRFDGSKLSDFPNFAPGSADDDPIPWVIDADSSPDIVWLLSAEQLFVGTITGAYSATPSAGATTGLTQGNMTVRRAGRVSCAAVPAVIAGGDAIYVQRHGRRLRALAYDLAREKFSPLDRTRLCHHITIGGMVRLHWMEEPLQMLWAVRGDGVLLGFTYAPGEEAGGGVLFAGMRRLLAPPKSGAAAVLRSACIIPGANGDELWLAVTRDINGFDRTHIEILADPFDSDAGDALADAWYLDAAREITGPVSSLTGVNALTHLLNDTVYANADGAKIGPLSVNGSGEVTLGASYTKVIVGLVNDATMQPMRPAEGSRLGTALEKTKQINKLHPLWKDSLDVQVGPSLSDLTAVPFPSNALFTGFLEEGVPIDGSSDRDADIYFYADGVHPFTMQALVPELDVREGSPT